MKSIHERVRAALAKQERDRKAAEYKAGESGRRSSAGRAAAEARQDKRDALIAAGELSPRNAREREIEFRELYGGGDL
jgi:hypothetical protein